MGRELHILWAGRHQRRPWEALCEDYRQRIVRQVPVRDQLVKVKTHGAAPARRRTEGRALLAACPDPSWIIALDTNGTAMSSTELAAELARLRRDWPHPVVFLIGSDLGLDPELLRSAHLRLSFGPLTLGHELARLVLYEQVYRSVSMERGIKYHRPPF